MTEKNKKSVSKKNNFRLLLSLSLIFLLCLFLLYQFYPAGEPPELGRVPIETLVVEATESSDNLVYGGLPKYHNKQKLTILKNIGFYAGYSEEHKNPLWVAYRIDKEINYDGLKRPSGFKADNRTNSKVSPNVFRKTGYDRGHLAPNSAIASRFGKDAQLETFLMSNITPQTPNLNRILWAKLERLETEYAAKYGPIWVVTGPIFGELVKQINNEIDIPQFFYKIIVRHKENHITTLTFIVPQDVSGREPLIDFLTSVDEVEMRTGLDFFSVMTQKYQDRLESYTEKKLW